MAGATFSAFNLVFLLPDGSGGFVPIASVGFDGDGPVQSITVENPDVSEALPPEDIEGDPTTGTELTVTIVTTEGETLVSPATYVGKGPNDEVLILHDDYGPIYVSNALVPPGTPLDVNVTDPWVCFAEGTLIATPTGLVAVEDLTIGDLVNCAAGGTTEVKWVGRQSRSKLACQAEEARPVRISAGALAENVPARDLTVTPDHAIAFEEALVHAAALVNGTTITRVALEDLKLVETYYHIETEGHAIILAEGCPAETFVDNVTRSHFDNYAEYVAAYGEETAEMNPVTLPRAKGARQVPAAIRARISERAVQLAGDMALVG